MLKNTPVIQTHEKTPYSHFVDFLYLDFYGEKKYFKLFKILIYSHDCTYGFFKEQVENSGLWEDFKDHQNLKDEQIKEIKFIILQKSVQTYLSSQVVNIGIQ